MLTVVKLKVGDLVADHRGTIGRVTAFTRDHVSIAWGEYEAVMRHTDEDLKAAGVVLVEGQR
jgi:hypothetical protein